MKLIRIYAFIALAGVWAVSGCSSEQNGKDPADGDSTGNVHADTLPPAFVFSENDCDSLKSFEFCHLGTAYAKLGEEIVWKEFDIEGATVKDTVFEQINTYEDGADTVDWNAKIIAYSDGRVLLETDFDEDKFLNRIQITTPSLRHTAGYHVGMTLGQLKDAFDGHMLHIRPFPEYNVIEVFPNTSLIFHIANEGYYKEGQTFDPEAIPASAKVTAIVVM